MDFLSSAKIMFIARAISQQSSFRDQETMSSALFSIMEACEFFKAQDNKHGQGSCFMVLGCIYASQTTSELSNQSRQHLLESLVYVIEAEKLQNDMLDSHLMDEKLSSHHD